MDGTFGNTKKVLIRLLALANYWTIVIRYPYATREWEPPFHQKMLSP